MEEQVKTEETVQPDGDQVVTGSFQDIVLQALKEKGVPSICRECGKAAGWKDWEFSPAPIVLMLMPPAQGMVPTACLLCLQCGYVRSFALTHLGIRIQQKRIITPGGATFH